MATLMKVNSFQADLTVLSKVKSFQADLTGLTKVKSFQADLTVKRFAKSETRSPARVAIECSGHYKWLADLDCTIFRPSRTCAVRPAGVGWSSRRRQWKNPGHQK